MERIGFSTGSLAASDFRSALALLRGGSTNAVELSALRLHELEPLLDAIPSLELSRFAHVSVHAPSGYDAHEEPEIASALRELALQRGWPIVLHPDGIHRIEHWRGFGPLLCIENMDLRKAWGRNAEELRAVFESLPDASLCFDVAHVRQFDSSMTEALRILQEFGGRLVEIHISDLQADSRHTRLTRAAITAYQGIAKLIPSTIPVIVEAPTTPEQMEEEVARALEALGRSPALAS